MSLRRVSIPSPNQSSRGGARVRLIVCHTAEGARTYQSLGSFFQNPASQVSSHVGIDDTANTVGEYVGRSQKAWTAAEFNPVAVQAELCAFASWNAAEWDRHQNMLANLAAWIAEESRAFGIPLVRLTPAQAQGSGAGICQHVDLGSRGGGHVDCGPAFPLDRVIDMARGSAPTPQPPHPEVEDLVPLTSMLDKDGYTVMFGVDDAGNLWEVTNKPPDPNTPMQRYYRWSNLTANGGQKLSKT